MKISDLTAEVSTAIDAGIAVELISAPGRGKSDFVEQLVAHLSKRDGFQWGYSTLFLATYTPSDLMGYLVPQKLEDGTIRSTFTTPAWMFTPEGKHLREYKRSIIFLDEYGQGEGDTKRAAAQLLLKGEVGPHKLPPGCGVIAASNRSADRSGVTKNYDFIINRRVQIQITDDLEAWKLWAASHGVHPLTMAFAEQNPNLVFSDGVPEKQGPWMTPRTLAMLDRVMQLKAGPGGLMPDDAGTIEFAGGLVGDGAATQYFAFVKLQREMPAFEKIVADPENTKVPTKPDAQMLVCYNLAHRVDEHSIDPVVDYINRLPKEFAVTFVREAVRRNNSLVKSPKMLKWCTTNASLMAAISGVDNGR